MRKYVLDESLQRCVLRLDAVGNSATWRETIRQHILELDFLKTEACVISKQIQNPCNDTEWLTLEDTEGEGREFVAFDGCIILFADDVLDTGNERHQTKSVLRHVAT